MRQGRTAILPCIIRNRSSFSKREEITRLSHAVECDEICAKLAPEIRLAYDGLIVEIRE